MEAIKHRTRTLFIYRAKWQGQGAVWHSERFFPPNMPDRLNPSTCGHIFGQNRAFLPCAEEDEGDFWARSLGVIVRIPKLAANGSVELESRAEHDALWQAHLCRGALPVKPEIPLQNFSYLNVQLTGAHLQTPLHCLCEVVVVQKGRVLLRIADEWPDEYERLALPAEAEWTEPEASVEPAASLEVAETHPYEEAREPADDAPATPSIPHAPNPQALRAAQSPAFLDEHSLRFFSIEHLALHEESLRNEHACIAFSTSPPATNQILSRKLSTTARESKTFCTFDAHPTPEGLLHLEVKDFSALEQALTEIHDTVEEVASSTAHLFKSQNTHDLPPEFSTDSVDGEGQNEFFIGNWTDRKKLPVLREERLDFQTEFDFVAARDDLLAVGATMATCDETLHAVQTVNLQLTLGGELGLPPLRATLTPTGGPNVLAQFENLKHLAGAIAAGWQSLDAIEYGSFSPEVETPCILVDGPTIEAQPAMEPERARERDESAVPLVLSYEGQLENPTTVDELLDLALMRTPKAYELEPPSLFMLFRWLLTTTSTLEVEIHWEDRTAHTLYILEGSRFRAPVEARTLSRPFAFVSGSYRITDVERPPAMTHNGRTAHLFMHILRSWMLVHPIEDLEEALSSKLTKAPRLTQTGRTLVDRLGLEGANRRIALHKLDGSYPLEEVLQAAAGNRSALETVYMMMIADGLEWLDETVEGRAHVGLKKRQAQAALSSEEQFWQSIENANYFLVMGLHWSVAPFEIPEAYKRLTADWGPKGRRRETSDLKTADLIWGRICEAHSILNDQARRQAYRKKTFQLQWSQQVGLLHENAQLASYREDPKEAMRLLLAAEDVLPSATGARLLRKLRAGKQLIDEVEPEAQYEKKR